MTYYRVVAKIAPWTFENTVGYYQNQELARKVADFVREINIGEIPGGIDVCTELYEGEVIPCFNGYKLKESQSGIITLVRSNLDREEYSRLFDMKFKDIDVNVIKLFAGGLSF